MPRFTLRQLAYFKAIAATGSISAAAAAESVSRSALTSALDALEQSLRTQLFVRHKAHGVILTPTGERILEMANALLQDAEQIEASIDQSHLTGSVAVGCFSSLGPTIVPTLFDALAADHPGVTVRAYTESADRLMQLLLSGEIEIAIGYNTHLDRALQTVPLFETRMHGIVSADHPAAAQPVIAAIDLVEEPLILLDVPPSPEYVSNYFRELDLSPVIRHRFPSFEVVRSLVARGYGYSLFIQQPASGVSYEGVPVVAKPLLPAPRRERVGVAWPAGRRLSTNAKAAVDALRAHVDRIQPPDLYS
ncbi:LysR substrate-binding domain-containing protein [Rhodococcus wratislaviensis]|uniref:LysR substrate-binding domain-containing protein n=1 Tax=Rhodococcus wratislaviensis TaxID=44752 RepID=UPI0035136A6A